MKNPTLLLLPLLSVSMAACAPDDVRGPTDHTSRITGATRLLAQAEAVTTPSPAPGSVMASSLSPIAWQSSGNTFAVRVGVDGADDTTGRRRYCYAAGLQAKSFQCAQIPEDGAKVRIEVTAFLDKQLLGSKVWYLYAFAPHIVDPAPQTTLVGPSQVFTLAPGSQFVRAEVTVGSDKDPAAYCPTRSFSKPVFRCDQLPHSLQGARVRVEVRYYNLAGRNYYTEVVSLLTHTFAPQPPAGSVLSGPWPTFQWSYHDAIAEYGLAIGDIAPGSFNLRALSVSGSKSVDVSDKGGAIGSVPPMPQDGRTIYARLWYRPTGLVCTLFSSCPYVDYSYVARSLVGLQYVSSRKVWMRMPGHGATLRPTPPLAEAQQILRWTNQRLHRVRLTVGSTQGASDIAPTVPRDLDPTSTSFSYDSAYHGRPEYIRLSYVENEGEAEVWNDYVVWQPLYGAIRRGVTPSLLERPSQRWSFDIRPLGAEAWRTSLVDLQTDAVLSTRYFEALAPDLYDVTFDGIPIDGRYVRVDLAYEHPDTGTWQLADTVTYHTSDREYSDIVLVSMQLKQSPNVHLSSPTMLHRGTPFFVDAIALVNNARAPRGAPSFAYEDVTARLIIRDAATMSVILTEDATGTPVNPADNYRYVSAGYRGTQYRPETRGIYFYDDVFGFSNVSWMTGSSDVVTYAYPNHGPREGRDAESVYGACTPPDLLIASSTGNALTQSGIATGFRTYFDELVSCNIRRLNNDWNSHQMPARSYAIRVEDDVPNSPEYDIMVFTFEIDSARMHEDQEIYFEARIDPEEVIEEYFVNDPNNYLVGRGTAHIVSAETMLETVYGPEAMATTHRCNEWIAHQPNQLLVTVKKPGQIESGEYDMFGPSAGEYASEKADGVYLAEYWGPYGSGRYHDQIAGWIDAATERRGGRRPTPDEIEHVFFLAAGNSGWQYGPGNTAGYFDTGYSGSGYDLCTCEDPFGSGTSEMELPMNASSWAGNIIDMESLHALHGHYDSGSSLLGLAFHPNYKWSYDEKSALRAMYLNWMKARTNNFRNVKNIVLGGFSRGGVLALALARDLRRYLQESPEYAPSAEVDHVKIVVLAQDPAGTKAGDNINLIDDNFQIGGSAFGNGNCHDLRAAYGLPDYATDQSASPVRLYVRINVGEAKAMDSVFQWHDCDGAELVDPSELARGSDNEWLEQVMVGYGHMDMGSLDHPVLVADMLSFMGRRLGWSITGRSFFGDTLPAHCEICDDGVDNDRDSRVDCDDLDCLSACE